MSRALQVMIALLLTLVQGQVRVQEDACKVCVCSHKAIQTLQIRSVICDSAGLFEVPTNIPADTEVLSLKDNKLTAVQVGDFSHLSSLKVLTLSENDIKALPIGNNDTAPGIFKGIEKLEELDMRDNLLEPAGIYDQNLNLSSFHGLSNLKILDLGKNKLSEIPPLYPLPSVEVLRLDFNEMPKLELPIDSISHLSTLKQLHMRGCLLEKDIPDLSLLANLEVLDLSYNRLQGAIPQTLFSLIKLKVRLPPNSFSCMFVSVLFSRH